MGMIRGSGFAVMVSVGEAVSADPLISSKGLLPSVLEVGGATCGLEVIKTLSEEDRELDEDDSIAVEGI